MPGMQEDYEKRFISFWSSKKTADFLSKCGFFYAIWVKNPSFLLFIGLSVYYKNAVARTI